MTAGTPRTATPRPAARRRSRHTAWWIVGALASIVLLLILRPLVPGADAPAMGDNATPTTAAAPSATRSPRPSPPAISTPAPTPTHTVAPAPTHTVAPEKAASGTALAALAELEIKGRAPKTGYDRDQFGQRWKDVDRNGCGTRDDILARDLTAVEKDGRCTVTGGILDDPFTGGRIRFERGQDTSALVQIDHVVAMSDAWQKGAQRLTAHQREVFANDPLNLLAVDGSANAQKGDGDAATWLPSNKAFRCAYVARQVAVKAAYELWVTKAEFDAIARVLSACPDEKLLPSDLAPAAMAQAAEPTPAPTPDPTKKPDPTKNDPAAKDVYYRNCAAARAAGAAPVYEGDPGYAKHLDRDGDGVGCEG